MIDVEEFCWFIEEAGPAFKSNGNDEQAAGGYDDSGSGRKFRAGLEMRKNGATLEEMDVAFLNHEDPEIRNSRKKEGKRGTDRIYAKATLGRKQDSAPRERVAALRPDEEVGPVMKLLDDILVSVETEEPPMRDVEGWPVEIQCREIVGLHELTPDGANDAEDEKSRLPSPKTSS